MRQPRLKGQGPAFYHCISRVTNGERIFQTTGPTCPEAESFVRLMHRLAAFCGIPILTYAVMANHFHLLCEVPPARLLSDPELLERLETLEGAARRRRAERVLAGQTPGGTLAAQALRQRLQGRMGNLSRFLQELKGRFAQGYNRRHGRFGALWAERFKSLLIEDGPALAAVALYIDLNPVRAGVCLDPKDYRYSGYGEAVGSGRAQAWAGLARALGYEGGPAGVTGAEAGAEYRRRLFRTGVVASKAAQGVVEMEQARRVVEEEKGALPLEERLGCRLRFLTYGVVLGGQRFVEEHGARVCRAVAKAAGAAAGGWFVWRRGQAVPVTASD